ncbi:ROK family protein [Saccharopolyspora dendranthemae]|uniref:ROK family protein n=1 Tax=Saccharopolyspora dendranthemae TaxID=1181886 RepID=A0A561V7Q8_9PSEU|nr:ROK family protein [Saccharopolyspora dendranthemae]
MLATLVSFYNPSLFVIGGGVAKAGDLLLATIRQNVYQRSLPLATRELRIEQSALHDRAGLTGAAFMVHDELFTPSALPDGSTPPRPTNNPGLAEISARVRPGRGRRRKKHGQPQQLWDCPSCAP